MKIEVKENNYTIDIDYKSDLKLKNYLNKNRDAKYLVITYKTVFYIYSETINYII